MTLSEHLDEFYKKYNIPANGGVNDKTFEVPFPYFTLTLPNFSWRKRALYVHDLEHILNEQDTSWSGEMFYCLVGNFHRLLEKSAGHHFPSLDYGLGALEASRVCVQGFSCRKLTARYCQSENAER